MSTREPERLTTPPDGRVDAEQPRWRQDFPIDWPDDAYVSRRDFVKFLVLTSLAFTIGQFVVLAQSLLRQRATPPAAGDRAAGRGAGRRLAGVYLSRPARQARAGAARRADARRLRPELHAPLVPGDCAARRWAAALPVP